MTTRLRSWPLALSLLLGLVVVASCSKEPEAPPPPPMAKEPESVARAKPDFGGVEKVTVRVTGEGPSMNSAVDQAVVSAIRQVNGMVVDTTTMSVTGGIAVSNGEDEAAFAMAAFAEAIVSASHGAVTGFKIVSHRRTDAGLHVIEADIDVAKFKQPESAGLPRLIVAPIRTGSTKMVIDRRAMDSSVVAGDLARQVTEGLSASKRFTLLDREFTPEIEAEMNFIGSGEVNTADLSRLGQALAADLVWTATLERFEYVRHERALRTSDRTVVSHSGGARMTHRLINLATRQVVLTSTVETQLPETEPTTLGTSVDAGGIGSKLIAELASRAVRDVMSRLYPITIVARQGADVVLSQGVGAVQTGHGYRVYQLGTELKDPQTGASLGRLETACAVVDVTTVSENTARGTLRDVGCEMPEPLVAGSLEVREEIVAAAGPAAVAEGEKAPAAGAKKRKTDAADAKSPGTPAVPAADDDKDW